MCVGFALLAGGATFDVFFDEMGHSWPPVSCRKQLFGFEVSRVTGRWVIMEAFDEFFSEIFFIRYVDLSLIR